LKNRVLFRRAFERPERYAVKVARTVLRGGSDSNVTSLPDQRSGKVLDRWCNYMSSAILSVSRPLKQALDGLCKETAVLQSYPRITNGVQVENGRLTTNEAGGWWEGTAVCCATAYHTVGRLRTKRVRKQESSEKVKSDRKTAIQETLSGRKDVTCLGSKKFYPKMQPDC
jgi:hypothetical protein